MAIDENAKIATELQIKYEIYLITLTFTLLGLAIQTSKAYAIKSVAACETTAWVALLVAGLIGLYRIVYSSLVMHSFSHKCSREKWRDSLATAKQQGIEKVFDNDGSRPIGDAIDDLDDQINTVEKDISKRNNSLVRLFKLQVSLFVTSCLLLVYARGYDNIMLVLS